VRRDPLVGGANAAHRQPDEYRDLSLEVERQEEVVDHEAEDVGGVSTTDTKPLPTVAELPRMTAGEAGGTAAHTPTHTLTHKRLTSSVTRHADIYNHTLAFLSVRVC
jgi:hypothetical protein